MPKVCTRIENSSRVKGQDKVARPEPMSSSMAEAPKGRLWIPIRISTGHYGVVLRPIDCLTEADMDPEMPDDIKRSYRLRPHGEVDMHDFDKVMMLDEGDLIDSESMDEVSLGEAHQDGYNVFANDQEDHPHGVRNLQAEKELKKTGRPLLYEPEDVWPETDIIGE